MSRGRGKSIIDAARAHDDDPVRQQHGLFDRLTKITVARMRSQSGSSSLCISMNSSATDFLTAYRAVPERAAPRIASLCAVLPTPALSMIRHMRLGEAGMSTWVTPRCESASTTALMTVAGAPIVQEP